MRSNDSQLETELNEHSASSAGSTDIDRLHRVVMGERHRGSGKTFAACHELCGVLEVGVSKVVMATVSQMRDVDFLLRDLRQVFAEHEIEIVKLRRDAIRVSVPGVGERVVRFARAEDERAMLGMDCNVVSFIR